MRTNYKEHKFSNFNAKKNNFNNVVITTYCQNKNFKNFNVKYIINGSNRSKVLKINTMTRKYQYKNLLKISVYRVIRF